MTDFTYDRQTLSDLEIFREERRQSPSVFSLFNETLTPGGSTALKDIMSHPYADQTYLQQRIALFQYLNARNITIPLRSHQVEAIERYLELSIPILKPNFLDRWYKKVSEWLTPTNEYYLITTGIRQLLTTLKMIHEQIDFDDEALPELLKKETREIQKIHQLMKLRVPPRQPSIHKLATSLDQFFRKAAKERIITLVQEVYRLDAFIAIAKSKETNGFHYPEYSSSGKPNFDFKALRHPLLSDAVPYHFQNEDTVNMCFLTGPNMAGKSTFLKAVGIAIYLAHLGFPIPARSARLSVYKGLITTINLSDDLGLGHSHYFAEVNRVREVADLLHQQQPLLVIFDELFRGTNVKDAFDASREVISAFARLRQSTFLISTHIVEVAEVLDHRESIQFKYMDLTWEEDKPAYHYKLKAGVSGERLGMHIIRKAGILETLKAIN